MKKSLLFLIPFFAFVFHIQAVEVEYHFQEGFARGVPIGWTGNNSRTNTAHSQEDPVSATKFDKNYENGTNYLETPSFANAGVLSFYITRSAVRTYMDFVVYQISDNTATEIYRMDAQNITHNKTGWDHIVIPVNTEETVSFRFAVLIEDNNEGWLAVDDMELTKYTDPEGTPGDGSIAKITTDFGDGTWGEVLSGNPTSGSYTDSEINGFILTKAVVVKASVNCPTGVKHTNRIDIDKNSLKGAIEFPLLKDVGELEIHAQSGSPASFKLQEYIGNNWSDIGTYNTLKDNDSVYIIPLNRTNPIKLRIANNTGSRLLIYHIASTTYKENQELNLTGSTPGEGGLCYYNLTNTITLKFNKEIVMGTGEISLNDVKIPLTVCTIEGKEVTVPVELEGSPSYKSYVVSIPRGAFLEKGNESNTSNPATVNFRTNKTIKYPANYNGEIDVVYSTANVDFNRLDIYYPTSPSQPVPLLINIHGGGWNHGEKEAQSGFNSLFAQEIAVANIEYRMTPQATAPAAVVDARCAMMYLLENAAKYNIDVNRIVFMGSSAGAHLALTAGYLQNDNRYDTGSNYSGEYKIVAVIDKYGPANLEKFLHYKSLGNWLGEYAEDFDFMKTISPVHLVNNATTPPTYIVHGDADAIVEYEQSEFLVEALENEGVYHKFTTIPGGGHGGLTTEEYAQIDSEITAFLSEILFRNITGIEVKDVEGKSPISIDNNGITINIEGEATTEIFDLSGKSIMRTRHKKIELKQSGFFVAKIKTVDGEYSYKIVR